MFIKQDGNLSRTSWVQYGSSTLCW